MREMTPARRMAGARNETRGAFPQECMEGAGPAAKRAPVWSKVLRDQARQHRGPAPITQSQPTSFHIAAAFQSNSVSPDATKNRATFRRL